MRKLQNNFLSFSTPSYPLKLIFTTVSGKMFQLSVWWYTRCLWVLPVRLGVHSITPGVSEQNFTRSWSCECILNVQQISYVSLIYFRVS